MSHRRCFKCQAVKQFPDQFSMAGKLCLDCDEEGAELPKEVFCKCMECGKVKAKAANFDAKAHCCNDCVLMSPGRRLSLMIHTDSVTAPVAGQAGIKRAVSVRLPESSPVSSFRKCPSCGKVKMREADFSLKATTCTNCAGSALLKDISEGIQKLEERFNAIAGLPRGLWALKCGHCRAADLG